MGKCYVVQTKKKGTSEKFKTASPYIFPKKSDFGSLTSLKRNNPTRDVRIAKIKCPLKKNIWGYPK